MRVVSVVGENKVTTFGPHRKGPYKWETTVYDKGKRRLIVDSTYKDGTLTTQTKTYLVDGQRIKEILITYNKGIRDNVLNVIG